MVKVQGVGQRGGRGRSWLVSSDFTLPDCSPFPTLQASSQPSWVPKATPPGPGREGRSFADGGVVYRGGLMLKRGGARKKAERKLRGWLSIAAWSCQLGSYGGT